MRAFIALDGKMQFLCPTWRVCALEFSIPATDPLLSLAIISVGISLSRPSLACVIRCKYFSFFNLLHDNKKHCTINVVLSFDLPLISSSFFLSFFSNSMERKRNLLGYLFTPKINSSSLRPVCPCFSLLCHSNSNLGQPRKRREIRSWQIRDNCCDSLLLFQRSCNVHKHTRSIEQYTCLWQMSLESTVWLVFGVHRSTVRTVSFTLKWERYLRWIFLRLPIGIFLLLSTNSSVFVKMATTLLLLLTSNHRSLATTTITICENEKKKKM